LTNESERKPEQRFDAAFGNFVRSKQKLYIYFPLDQGRQQNLKTICECTENTA
jgi:hypothetical protein